MVAGGVRYRTWCEHNRVEVVILDPNGIELRALPLDPESSGYFSGLDAMGRAGDLYKYRFEQTGSWPDPASRFQPDGVHGPSMVVDPEGYRWADQEWSAPAFGELIIYELHVGTFTEEGTFRGAISKLGHLTALGINAIELMPVADFPGERNWGYDGVMLYAPARAYGTPDEMRAFVDAAHRAGIAVILDVVYNHLGPDGNYMGLFHAGYNNPAEHTPWGAALNYGAPPVRSFFVENAAYWMREFHVDGFRLDATHTIVDHSPQHILAEIAETVQARGGFVIAEDERNEPMVLAPRSRGGWGFDGVWADDFHHVVRVLLTGEDEGYYANFRGESEELAQTVAHGWLFRGQVQGTNGEVRGGDGSGFAPSRFVYCISNHDQVGNRAFGERLHHSTSLAAYCAASALLCLVPQTPMFFMGQEWAASTPFQFFTNHERDLGQAITVGRRREFRNFRAFRDPNVLQTIPDPQERSTFLESKLRWAELNEPGHSAVLLLYWEFLELRKTAPAFRSPLRESCVAVDLGQGIFALLFGRAGHFDYLVLSDLAGGHEKPNLDDPRLAPGGGKDWRLLLASNEKRFGGNGPDDFSAPATRVFESV